MITIKCNVESKSFKIGGQRILKGEKRYRLDTKDPAIRYQLRVLRDEGIIEYKEQYPPVDQKKEVPIMPKDGGKNDNAVKSNERSGDAGRNGTTDISGGSVSKPKRNKSSRRGGLSK